MLGEVGLDPLVFKWLRAFAITQLAELPVYYVALSGPGGATGDDAVSPRPPLARVLIGFCASLITHPAFVFLLHPALIKLGPWPALLLGEGLVIAVEGLWLRYFGVPRPWLWALTANALSVAVGATLAL